MELERISPIDDRYWEKCKELSIFSEKNLYKIRTKIECEYLIFLSEQINNPNLDEKEKKKIRTIYKEYNDSNFKELKSIEKETKHDVKAVELFVKRKLKNLGLKNKENMIHFGLTSEDVNNLSFSMILRSATKIVKKQLNYILEILRRLSKENKDLTILARTHGQPASPTTLGKELTIYYERIKSHLQRLEDFKFPGKISGATGNYNSFQAAYPEMDWISITKKFVKSFDLEPSIFNTQIMPHDKISKFLRDLKSINLVLIDLNSDIWDYISRNYFVLKSSKKEIGSSTMPHKVNPINFENSEGNLKIANSILTEIADNLQTSRLQRDLTDSTVKRNYGVPISHSLLGYKNCLIGLKKIKPSEEEIKSDLNKHPEIITEAIQTILRREGYKNAYENVRRFSKGKKRNLKEIKSFINDLEVSEKVKEELLSLKPIEYTGLASELVEISLQEQKN